MALKARPATVTGRSAAEAAKPVRTVFDQTCPLMPKHRTPYSLIMTTAKTSSQHDEILKAPQPSIEGSKEGKSEIMRPAFHPQASSFRSIRDGETPAASVRWILQ